MCLVRFIDNEDDWFLACMIASMNCFLVLSTEKSVFLLTRIAGFRERPQNIAACVAVPDTPNISARRKLGDNWELALFA